MLGPLVSARLEHGDRTAYFAEAAARHHLMPPDGRVVRLSPRTIGSWFYLYKQGGFEANSRERPFIDSSSPKASPRAPSAVPPPSTAAS